MLGRRSTVWPKVLVYGPPGRSSGRASDGNPDAVGQLAVVRPAIVGHHGGVEHLEGWTCDENDRLSGGNGDNRGAVKANIRLTAGVSASMQTQCRDEYREESSRSALLVYRRTE